MANGRAAQETQRIIQSQAQKRLAKGLSEGQEGSFTEEEKRLVKRLGRRQLIEAAESGKLFGEEFLPVGGKLFKPSEAPGPDTAALIAKEDEKKRRRKIIRNKNRGTSPLAPAETTQTSLLGV